MKKRQWIVWVLLLALGVWLFRSFTDYRALGRQLGQTGCRW